MKLIIICEDLDSKLRLIEKAISSKDEKDQKRIAALKSENNLTDAKDIATFLSGYDPTGSKATYILWILRLYIKDRSIRLPEDGDRIKRSLYRFNKIKNKRSYTDEKDIYKIGLVKGLRELEAIVGKYKEDVEYESLRSFRHFIDANREKYLRLLYSDNNYKYFMIGAGGQTIDSVEVLKKEFYSLFIPKDLATEEEIEVAFSRHPHPYVKLDIAAYVLADIAKDGTTWCVSNERTAHTYLKLGPMYIMYKNDKPYYLATNNYSEVMSAGDEQVPLSGLVSYKLLVAFSKMLVNDQIRPQLSPSSQSAMKLRIRSANTRLKEDNRLTDAQIVKLSSLFDKALETKST